MPKAFRPKGQHAVQQGQLTWSQSTTKSVDDDDIVVVAFKPLPSFVLLAQNGTVPFNTLLNRCARVKVGVSAAKDVGIVPVN
jgi:hypothetical protein